MILVDTSVWADHFRTRLEGLQSLLERGQVAVHSFVIGELALGHLKHRNVVLESLNTLPAMPRPRHQEVLAFIEAGGLAGKGIGLIDTYLLAAVRLRPGSLLWTRDRKLAAAADAMSLAYAE
jgi:predicted nucleic acid-binding protein